MGHYIWAAVLGLAAACAAWTMLSIIPHMSSGTLWTNVPMALFMAAGFATPPAVLAAWLWRLGRDLWANRRPRRGRLIATHTALLTLGALSMALGNAAFRAAEESAKRGGGLLGGLGIYPLGFGVFVVLLALPSLTALVLVPGLGRGAGSGTVGSGR